MNLNSTQIEFFKQRDLGEKINVTFDFLKRNFKEIFQLLLKTALPIVAFIVIIPAFFPEYYIGSYRQVQYFTPPVEAFFVMLIYGIGFFIASLYTQSTVLSLLYQKTMAERMGEHDFDLKQAIRKNIFVILWTSLLSGLIIMGCSLLLIIPGIIVGVMLSYASTAAIFEKSTPSQAISKCWGFGLTKWWSTLGLIIVMSLITGIIGFIFGLPAYIVSMITLFTGSGIEDSGIVMKILFYVFQVVAVFGSLLVSCLTVVALSFQYANVREIKESVSIKGQISDFENL
jgi:hypothetical protein